MNDLINRTIKIGSSVSLIFENLGKDNPSNTEENLLNATLAIKFLD